MGNKNRGGATNIKYVPDEKAKVVIDNSKFAKKIKALEKEKEDLEGRVLIMEEKFTALEKFIGVKEENGVPEEKKEPK